MAPISFSTADLPTLSVAERIDLIGMIWDTIAAETEQSLPTTDQRRELERRLAAHLANPQDVVPWEEVKAQALKRAHV